MWRFVRFGPRRWRYRVEERHGLPSFDVVIEAPSVVEADMKAAEIGFGLGLLLVGPL